VTAVDKLRALREAATPGPWKTDRCTSGGRLLIRGDTGTHVQSHLQVVPSEDAFLIVALVNAAPQIEALIEAAEKQQMALRESTNPQGSNVYPQVLLDRELIAALAALKEALA
jgi:hypothetical protein